MAEPTREQRKAIGAFVKGTLSPLIAEVLTKKLSQAATFIADELRRDAERAANVTDEQIQAVWEAMPGGRAGFLTHWGYLTFAREVLALVAAAGVAPCDDARDAARYRWLRNFGNFAVVDQMLDSTEFNTLDLAVDSAMGAAGVDVPATPEPPPECKTDDEKRAFAFGWFKAMETRRIAGVPGTQDDQGEKA